MRIEEFVDGIIEAFPSLTDCYIAIVPGAGEYVLEVMVGEKKVGGRYVTGAASLIEARGIADDLEDLLDFTGVTVWFSRLEWENHLYSQGVTCQLPLAKASGLKSKS